MKRLIWILVAVWITATASAQSLVDVAKKEKQRREEIGSSGSPTVTETELRRAGGPRAPAQSSVTTSSASEDDGDEGADNVAEDEDEPLDERRDEAYWRSRIDPINTRIATMETRLQGPEFTANPVGGADRQRLEARIAAAKAERQTILDEARRKGVPPGWLR